MRQKRSMVDVVWYMMCYDTGVNAKVEELHRRNRRDCKQFLKKLAQHSYDGMDQRGDHITNDRYSCAEHEGRVLCLQTHIVHG